MDSEMIIDYQDQTKLNLNNSPIKNLENFFITRVVLVDLAEKIRKLEVLHQVSPVARRIGMRIPDGEYIQKEWDELLTLDNSNLVIEFHKFSILLINYIRTVAFLKFLLKNNLDLNDLVGNKDKIDDSKRFVSGFLNTCIGDVLKWRNKVSAHFSATDPRKIDDLLTLENSMSTPIDYVNGHLYVNSIEFDHRNGIVNFGKMVGHNMTGIPAWSPTEVFDKLAPRFWPDKSLKNLKLAYYTVAGVYNEFNDNVKLLRNIIQLCEASDHIYSDLYLKFYLLLKENSGLLWLVLENLGIDDKILLRNQERISFKKWMYSVDLKDYYPGSIKFYDIILNQGSKGLAINPNHVTSGNEINICKCLSQVKVVGFNMFKDVFKQIEFLQKQAEVKYNQLNKDKKAQSVRTLIPPDLTLQY